MITPNMTGQYKVQSTVAINAPKEQAWQLLHAFSDATWAPGVKASHSIGNPELGVGAGRHCTLEGFGEIDEYITQWSEGTGFVYSVTPLGPLHNANSSWWLTEIDAQHCQLDLVISYDIRFGPIGKLMHALIMRKKLEASLPATAAAVKTRVEGGVFAPPEMGEPTLAS